jgi:hypothetical protein
MSRFVFFSAILSTAFFLSACGGSAPITLAPWQPWARTLKTTTAIPPASRIRVEIKGQNNVLLGDEQLLRNKIQEKLTQVLTRKGLKAGSDTYDFKLAFTYKTDRYDKQEAAKIASPHLGGVLLFTGQGVTIAGKVGTFAPQVPPMGQSSVEQPALFLHNSRSGYPIQSDKHSACAAERHSVRRFVPAGCFGNKIDAYDELL